MLIDLLSAFSRQASTWILAFFDYVFPEYPKIGYAVFISAAIFFVYYLLRGRFKLALQMGLSTLAFFIVLLYAVHLIIKLYRIMI